MGLMWRNHLWGFFELLCGLDSQEEGLGAKNPSSMSKHLHCLTPQGGPFILPICLGLLWAA